MGGSFLADLLLSVTGRGRALLWGAGTHPNGDAGDLVDRCEALISGHGEATGMAMARDVLDRFARLDAAGQIAFFRALANSFGADEGRLAAAVSAWRKTPDAARETELHFASEPRRQELLRRLNRAPGGTAALVGMRKALLGHLKSDPDLAIVDRDLLHLLSSWFNRGFLTIRRIDWSTPANILEKIIRYEAVHAISDWDDLRRRVDAPDRRCYGFFHPTLGDEPLIFVEVALTGTIPDAIEPILAVERTPEAPASVKTAVFYSISNCQEGLRGVSFGSFLIKQVVDELARDLPGLTRFVTLSPVPGFRGWLTRLLQSGDGDVIDAEQRGLLDLINADDWIRDQAVSDALRDVVMPLAARYLLQAKNRRGEPVDQVARFHLGNGARLERINWCADLSENGLHGGAGLMVNYLYDLAELEHNHEAFANKGEIATAPKVMKLLKSAPRARLPAST